MAFGLTVGSPATVELAQVITHSMAPVFLLAAVAGFVSLLSTRANGIIERIRAVNAISGDDGARGDLRADLPRLQRRAKLVNRRGARAREDAVQGLAKLAGQPEDARIAASLGDPFMFQAHYRDRAPDFLGKEFGPPVSRAVAALAPGSWQGPVESGFGWHLVFVDTVIPGRVPFGAFWTMQRLALLLGSGR